MKTIGVTGGIGSGKSVVCAMLADCGGIVIDADKIARDILRPGLPAYDETVAAFGDKILKPDREIDRKALAAIVFSDTERLECLNRITHKYVFDEMRRQLGLVASDGVAILDVPLLFGSDFPFECDRTVAVLADREIRLKRAIQRDSADRESIEKRMDSQISDDEYRLRADICIDNSGSLDTLRLNVQKIYDGVRNEMCE